MSVTGAKKVSAALRHVPERVRERVAEAIAQAAMNVLRDMQMLTPYDAANPGPHARDGLTVIFADHGLTAHVGLPSPELTSDYFWFRFLDLGTKGGEVKYRRRKSTKIYTMRVPSRPALRIRERALDGNDADIRQMVRDAVRTALAEAQ